jgi:hypothetical protein
MGNVTAIRSGLGYPATPRSNMDRRYLPMLHHHGQRRYWILTSPELTRWISRQRALRTLAWFATGEDYLVTYRRLDEFTALRKRIAAEGSA